MHNLLLVHEIPSKIVEIIRESKEYCFLVTPYFQAWPVLERELEKASQKQKKIVFVFRQDENLFPFRSLDYLNTQYGFDVVYTERLHTKLYMNEQQVLITSMNLYDSSKENNYELGYVLNGRSFSKQIKETVLDDDIFISSQHEVLQGRYFNELREKEFSKKQDEAQRGFFKVSPSYEGYCIRCGRPKISSGFEKPLCPDCYVTWRQFENLDYEENYCYLCGKRSENISYRHCICMECARKV